MRSDTKGDTLRGVWRKETSQLEKNCHYDCYLLGGQNKADGHQGGDVVRSQAGREATGCPALDATRGGGEEPAGEKKRLTVAIGGETATGRPAGGKKKGEKTEDSMSSITGKK